MAAQFLVGFKRKRAVLVCLSATCILTFGLAIITGLSEVRLPLKTQLDELRLLDPSFVAEIPIDRVNVSSLAPELELSVYSGCREKELEGCHKHLKSLLESRPSDGRLWLEYSRSLTVENGWDEEAATALKNSFDYAPREFWMLEARSSFTLSIWTALPENLKKKASDEIVRGIANYGYANFISSFYVDRFLSRKVIAQILESAPVADQKRVLGLINAKSKT